MRIAFVSPWFRSLAHLYGRLLEQAGHEVFIATSDLHFESGYGYCNEVVATVRGTSRIRSSVSIVQARRAIAAFGPDVVVEDALTDPRWSRLVPSVPHVVAVHDPHPHDASHRPLRLRAATERTQRSSADRLVCFSRSAAAVLGQEVSAPVSVVPLLSEMPDEWFEGCATERRGFVLLGRLSHYKGIDLGLSAWLGLPAEVRRANPLLALVSEGDESVLASLRATPDVEVRLGRFSYRSVSRAVAGAHAVLLPYRAASQSGVQLMALQHGVQPVVAALPGLIEYQPTADFAVPVQEHEGWATALARRATGSTSVVAGSTARRHYETVADPASVVAAWEAAVFGAVGQRLDEPGVAARAEVAS